MSGRTPIKLGLSHDEQADQEIEIPYQRELHLHDTNEEVWRCSAYVPVIDISTK